MMKHYLLEKDADGNLCTLCGISVCDQRSIRRTQYHALGAITTIPENVTCKRCLRLISLLRKEHLFHG
jgi:hypothetical protein